MMDTLLRPETVWVLIPLVAIICGFATKWLRINAATTRGGDEKLTAEMRDAIQRLNDRVANLERAITTAETERKYAL